MALADEVTRAQRIEGANLIMEQGYITERDLPAMMDHKWSATFQLVVNEELRLRSLTERTVIATFHYYMGDGVIIYNPERLSAVDAKRTLRYALGLHK